jgi:hypothetical protein
MKYDSGTSRLRFSVAILAAFVISSLSACKTLGLHSDYRDYSSIAPPSEPFWNVWFESGDGNLTFQPITSASPGASLRLALDLSSLNLSSIISGGNGIAAHAAGANFLSRLESIKHETATLKILVVPSSNFFAPVSGEDRVYSYEISLKKLRKAMASEGFEDSAVALSELRRSGGDVEWNVAYKSSLLQLLPENVLRKSQPAIATVALVFWIQDPTSGLVPLGSISAGICVAQDHGSCESTGTIVTTLNGLQQISAALQLSDSDASMSDAALHFVELDSSSMIGIFHCGACSDWKPDEFEAWPLTVSSQELVRQLHDTILDGLETADSYNDDTAYARAGQALYDLLFGANDTARERFGEFVQLARERAKTRRPLKLFVRVLSTLPENVFAVPAALMHIPLPDGPEYLGNVVQLQSPLPKEDYSGGSLCNGPWTALIPGDGESDIEMKNVLGELDTWPADLHQSVNVNLFTNVDKFATWAADQKSQNGPISLLIVSHHEPGRLFFNSQTRIPAVFASSILRRFAPTSVAIVDACGAAKPGAFDVLKQLNLDNISTIVAATTSVDAYMGGAYLKLLMDHLEDKKGQESYTIGDANFDVVQDLRQLPRKEPGSEGKTFGAAALIFQVLGNPNAHICAPRAKN